MAIRLSLERWRHYLIGRHFDLLTDHAALTYLNSSAGVHCCNVRWLEFLSQFDFTISHIKGKENVVADSLSRIPGSQFLAASELCSVSHSLGVMHAVELPLSLYDAEVAPGAADVSPTFLNGIISINERDSFRDKLIAE